MKSRKLKYYFTLIALFFSAVSMAVTPTPRQIIDQMIAKTRQIKTLKYDLTMIERINNKMVKKLTFFKVNVSPFQAFTRGINPDAGQDALYKTGWNNDNLLVKPVSFPYITISLDPYGKIAHAGMHHTIFDSGYSTLINILEYLLAKYPTTAATGLTFAGDVMVNGINCYKIILDNPNFKNTTYKVQKNENLILIARKLKVCEYMILEMNGFKDYNSVSEGQIIKVPTDYATKMEICIDKVKMIPMAYKIYDPMGLFEQYEFNNVVVNPPFMSDEFNRDFKDYHF